MPKICPKETLSVFSDFLTKGIENNKLFIETIFIKAINTEKSYQTNTFAEILKALLDLQSKDPILLLKCCLLRKIQDVYEDQSL